MRFGASVSLPMEPPPTQDGDPYSTMPTEPIEGVYYVTGAQGRAFAVQIDLDKHCELWEDFEDALIADKRRDEPTVSYDEFRGRRLARSAAEH